MRTITILTAVFLAVTLMVSTALGGERSAKSRLADFLAGGQASPAPVAEERPKASTKPATAPSQATPVDNLRDGLKGTDAELFELGRTNQAEALALLTTGPELALLNAEDRYLRRKAAQIDLQLGDVQNHLDKERTALKDSFGAIARTFKPGTDAYKNAVAQLVERRRPRVEMLSIAVVAGPRTAEDLKNRIVQIEVDRAYWNFLAKDMAKPGFDITSILAGAAVVPLQTESGADPIEVGTRYQQSAEWLKGQGIDVPIPAADGAPRPTASLSVVSDKIDVATPPVQSKP